MDQKSCCLDQKGRASANRQPIVPDPLRCPRREASSWRVSDPRDRDARDSNQWRQKHRRREWSSRDHASVQVRAPGAVPWLLDVQYPGRGRDPDQKPDGQHLRPGGNWVNVVISRLVPNSNTSYKMQKARKLPKRIHNTNVANSHVMAMVLF